MIVVAWYPVAMAILSLVSMAWMKADNFGNRDFRSSEGSGSISVASGGGEIGSCAATVW